MPRCELYWPKVRRDEAVAQSRRLLQQYGRLLTRLGSGSGSWPGMVQFAFPVLDHPATLEDVRNGQAIFSLEGQGTVRCCHLLKRPAEARWLTFREEPFLTHRYDPEKKTEVPQVDYRQKGLVWQAEEVQVAGKWHRYYGFAAPAVWPKFPPNRSNDVSGSR